MPRVLSASMTSNLSTKFADGRAREFFWGITLNKDKPEYTWTFEEEDEDKDFLEHTLFLRHAVIGQGAVKDERNLVNVETKTFNGEDQKQPLFSLTLGKNDMCQLDINFGHELPVVFRLVEGTGPVHLSAQQLVEFPPENMDDTEMTDYTGTEDEELSDEDEDDELDTSAKVKGKKRKVSVDKGAAKKKKGKAADSSEEEEEDAEEEEENEGEDKEEDESMDEEDDDEEEEPSPEKKKGKSKTKDVKKKAAAKAVPAKKGKKKSK